MQSQTPGVLGSNSGPGTFNQYNYSLPADSSREIIEATRVLHERVAVAAIHNSADQGADAPKCHPQTREAVQQDIHSRLSHPGAQGGHIWLTGPAGTGKTAIVGSVCDKLQKDGRLAASFYFSSHKNSSHSRNRHSKDNFITTLAYQLQAHPGLHERISTEMLTTVYSRRVILDFILAEQAEALILRPFRDGKIVDPSTLTSPLTLAVDGIDECEEDYDTEIERQQGQVEVLRVLLSLANDPSFPCRIIIASRPEKWIRRFFEGEAAGRFREIFLDEKYNPDADIRLYYQSRFSRIRQEREYTVSEWPKREDLEKLVENASGQFIYAATVIRFLETAYPVPLEMLKLVLEVKAPNDGSKPFGKLDELYTAIIKKCSPCPEITVRWLQGVRVMKKILSREGAISMSLRDFTSSLFESNECEAKTIVAIPSLISPDYDFYHKSFKDYLEDAARSGNEFPRVDRSSVKKWLGERISKVLETGHPEVPLPSDEQTDHFREDFKVVWRELLLMWNGHLAVSQHTLANSDPAIWLPPPSASAISPHPFIETVYVFVHSECRFRSRCGAGCKRWRQHIMGDPFYRQSLSPAVWGSFALLLDQLCILRIRRFDGKPVDDW